MTHLSTMYEGQLERSLTDSSWWIRFWKIDCNATKVNSQMLTWLCGLRDAQRLSRGKMTTEQLAGHAFE